MSSDEQPSKKLRAESGAAVPTAVAAEPAAAAAATAAAPAAASATNASVAAPPAAAAHKPAAGPQLPASQRMRDDLLQLQLIKQGAEGRVYSCNWLGRPCIMKERFWKAYRHPSLEKSLSNERLRAEVRALAKARRQAPLLDTEDEDLAAALAQGKASVATRSVPACYTPAVFHVDEDQRRIYMERIEGITVKERMNQLQLDKPEDAAIGMKLAAKIGKAVAALHCAGIVHGDLTTSNLMLVPKPNSIGAMAVIDFGLATVSQLNEDRGVDLYVLERAFLSTHPNSEATFAAVLAAYQAAFPVASKVLSKLNVVRSRGRKRQMVG